MLVPRRCNVVSTLWNWQPLWGQYPFFKRDGCGCSFEGATLTCHRGVACADSRCVRAAAYGGFANKRLHPVAGLYTDNCIPSRGCTHR
eukprot:scaffold38236_cov36-Tisochrysis_lutea.AAC.5